jgi:hypothetical protein
VRWLAKRMEAFGAALNFLLLFASRKKVSKENFKKDAETS